MMKPLYKQPLVEAVILASGILCTVVLIHGIQNFIALGGKPVTSHVAQKSNPDLVNVAAGGACPYSASVSLGQTAGGSEMRKNPTSDPKIYTPFEPLYTNQKSGTATSGVAKAQGDVDKKLPIIGTIFGYKPQSVNYYKVLEKDGAALTGTRWEQYLIGVPTESGAEIRAPQTGYDIGGGKMGLVVYATSDQITIHVGRHEYLTGNGGSESGGYWIYLKGLCVNDQIVSQYNANAASRTQLPELSKGELLGYATSAEVLVAVRDNGPFQDILAPAWWGSVEAKVVVPKETDGEKCVGSACDTTKGAAKLGLGKNCTKNDECISNRCATNPPGITSPQCMQGTLTQGDTCTDPSQCSSNICKAGTGKDRDAFVCSVGSPPSIITSPSPASSPAPSIITSPSPASSPAPATGPEWVTNKNFCIDTSKQDLCNTGGEGMRADGTVFCGSNRINSSLLPLVQLQTFNEPCTHRGISYMDGTREITVSEGTTTSFDGINYCVYSAKDSVKTAVCAGSTRSCSGVCTVTKANVDFTIHITNNTGVEDTKLTIRTVSLKLGDTEYTASKSQTNTSNWSVSAPVNEVKKIADYLADYYSSTYSSGAIVISTNFTIQYSTGANNFSTKTYPSFPTEKPEFVISVRRQP